MKTDESNIVEQLRQGKEEAFKYLFDKHYGILCHVAWSITGDYSLAKDIVSDTFFHIWQIHDSLEIKTSLRGYLLTAVRNRALNFVAKDSRISRSPASEQALESSGPTANSPEEQLFSRETEDTLRRATEELSPECRQVFMMSRFEGKQYQQIAKELGISINTVKYHMKNALAHMRDTLEKYVS